MSLICPQWLQVFAHMQKKHKIHVKKTQCACMHVCAVTWLMYERKKHEKRHTMCMCACVCRHMVEVQVFACMKKKIHEKKTQCVCVHVCATASPHIYKRSALYVSCMIGLICVLYHRPYMCPV